MFKARYNYFKRSGIPGPSPFYFFGHYLTLWSLPDLSEQLRRWTRKYGSVYGLFEGARPMYVVSDADFLQEVFTKQFTAFNGRSLPFLMKTVKGHQVHMFGADGPTWRRQRQVINPAFSPAKLRLMSSLVSNCVQSLMNKLKSMEKEGNQFDVYGMCRRLSMDVICKYFVRTIRSCLFLESGKIEIFLRLLQVVVSMESIQICRMMLTIFSCANVN